MVIAVGKECAANVAANLKTWALDTDGSIESRDNKFDERHTRNIEMARNAVKVNRGKGMREDVANAVTNSEDVDIKYSGQNVYHSNGIEECKNIVNVVTNWRISMVEILETNDCSEQYTKVLLAEKERKRMKQEWIVINVRFDGHETLIIASIVEESAKSRLYWTLRRNARKGAVTRGKIRASCVGYRWVALDEKEKENPQEWQKFQTPNRWHRKYLQFAVSSAALICVNSGQANIEANILSKATLYHQCDSSK
ncbi:hypothetical protein WN51_14034 [Melipona quadrifasciata]|uniref:Uncharacterized protein n=1 Tax=Melipona quadrifasciata TaxID=166423 RepID=A0A0M9A0N7_9HYME|nr:hypothetical protein WN51_14034 [Melipona quadrifasciata]